MPKTNLLACAQSLPQAWRSTVVGRAANANIKVLRMDGQAYPEESHAFDEALLVLEGCMQLHIYGGTVAVQAGGVFIVPAGGPPDVAAASHGTLVIVDPPGG